MAAITEQSYQRMVVKFLEAKGWVFFTNSADVAYCKLGNLKFYDLEAAKDHQRHLDEQLLEARRAARPRYHWGLTAAKALGERP